MHHKAFVRERVRQPHRCGLAQPQAAADLADAQALGLVARQQLEDAQPAPQRLRARRVTGREFGWIHVGSYPGKLIHIVNRF